MFLKSKMVWFEDNPYDKKRCHPDLKIDKVIGTGLKVILQKRLDEFNGDAKKAFINLADNQYGKIKKKRDCYKRVTISGVSNAQVVTKKKTILAMTFRRNGKNNWS
jgi:CRISPR-associated endonuclease Csn1